MLRKLKIERFKSLVKLELELGRINVFIGANGSGKSNLLEGLGVLGAAAFGRVDDETLLRRGVRPGVPKLYRAAFPGKKKSVGDIGLEAIDHSGASLRVTLWNADKNQGAPWGYKTEKLIRSDRKGDVVASRSPNNREKLNTEQGLAAWATVKLQPGDPALEIIELLRSYSVYCPNTPSLRGLVQDLQAREPVGLAGGRLPEAIEELLQVARKKPMLDEALNEVRDLLDWASNFSAEPSTGVPLSPSAARSRLVIQFEDRFMSKGRNKLTGYDASEGALYILYYAALALHPRSPRCLAVDNLDQALNPMLAQRLMQAICSWTSQLNGGRQWLITAHNPAVLDGLPLNDPAVRLFTVDRNGEGHTVVRRIDLATALDKRPNKDWTLSRMWMSRLLGGVPNV